MTNKEDSKLNRENRRQDDRLRRRQQTTYTPTYSDLPEQAGNDCRQRQMYSTKHKAVYSFLAQMEPHSFLSLCECAVSSSLVCALSCPRVFCCVAHSSCFYRLRAFMLYLVWTCVSWVFSLSVCLFPVLHMAVDLFAGHVLVFVLCEHLASVQFSVCHVLSCQFILTPPILLPVYWLIFPSCSPSLPSSFAPFIISLCLQFRVGSLPYVGSPAYVLSCALSCPLSWSVPCLVLSCPVLSCLVLPACQFVFPLRGCFCLFYLLLIIKIQFSSCNWVLALFPSTKSDSICTQFHRNIIIWFQTEDKTNTLNNYLKENVH